MPCLETPIHVLEILALQNGTYICRPTPSVPLHINLIAQRFLMRRYKNICTMYLIIKGTTCTRCKDARYTRAIDSALSRGRF